MGYSLFLELNKRLQDKCMHAYNLYFNDSIFMSPQKEAKIYTFVSIIRIPGDFVCKGVFIYISVNNNDNWRKCTFGINMLKMPSFFCTFPIYNNWLQNISPGTC